MKEEILQKGKRIFFIGIKGTAMSGLAVICKQKGVLVSGSDFQEEFITDKVLKNNKIQVLEFSKDNIKKNIDVVVCGTSFLDTSPEVREAIKLKIPIITESHLRGMLSEQKKTIVIAGVHGKTTTTSLMSFILKEASLKPSWLIGTSQVYGLGWNAHWDSGEYFVVEGDEYISDTKLKLPKFLDLKPYYSIITSLEWEHVDVYKNVEILEKYFSQLIKNTKEFAICCIDWQSIKKIISGTSHVIPYGSSKDAEWNIQNFKQSKNFSTFAVFHNKHLYATLKTFLSGHHNALNILSCVCLGSQMGIDTQTLVKAVSKFQGVERRFEIVEKDGVTFIDDYGHHPTEVSVTLKAIRQKYGKRKIWCIFQPHMASRTKLLFNQFVSAFSSADELVVLDIFASAREKSESITSKDLVSAIQKNQKNVNYISDIISAYNFLKEKLSSNDVVVTMGAGDVYKVRDHILKNSKLKIPSSKL